MGSEADERALEERLGNLEAIVALLQTGEGGRESALPTVEPPRPAPADPMPDLLQHFAAFRARADALTRSFRDFSWDPDIGPPPAPAPKRAPDRPPVAELVLEKPRKRSFPTFFLPDTQARLAFSAVGSARHSDAPP
jgi:hypothetical protein